MISKDLRYLLPIMLAVSLAACGGGDGDLSDFNDNNGNGNPGGGSVQLRMGTLSGSVFTNGLVNIGVDTLSAGGSAQVEVDIVDQQGALYKDPVAVSFSSTCVDQDLADIDASVTTVAGRAVTTYIAKGCDGTDTITATATVGDATLSAKGSLTVIGNSLGSINFVSATPTIIGLQGAGGAGRSETSVMVFKVLNSIGDPVANAEVSFALNTNAGGLSLSPASGVSGADGTVETVVTSGTVITSVRVTATLNSTTIATQSDLLKVSSGLSDQDSFSISAETLNPEALDYDGERVAITARLADHFNNRVADGTTVSFTTEGGSIDDADSSCQTVNGACSVDWVSQNPRPVDDRPDDGRADGGRATILATAIGEESFTDTDGDGRLDVREDFVDLAEAYRDDDEDNVRDDGIEEFLDFDSDSNFDGPDGIYNGALCARDNASCNGDVPHSVHVRESIVLVMSGSSPVLQDAQGVDASGSLDLTGGGSGLVVELTDVNGQVLPAGTTIAASSTHGTVGDPAEYTVNNTNSRGPHRYGFAISGEDEPGSGQLTITVTTPKNVVSRFSFPVFQN